MGLHPLKLSDDEIQRLLTQAFRETGYSLERRDPILALYVIQKTLLHDFDESVRNIFSEFSDRVMPAIKEETKKMEERRDRLWDLARSAAEEVVHRAGEEYTQRIVKVMREMDKDLLSSLDTHITRLRGEQNRILEKLEEKHDAFDETAAQFGKIMTYTFLGGAAFFSILVFILVYCFAQ